jgi:UDP-N-acetylmuramyl pentapeptide phosphotransferase/UDP-N-acetylglucosamine-1-phosphate transferase
MKGSIIEQFMSNYLILDAVAFFASALCGFILIPQILNYCKQKKLYDIPNERKVHKNFIPRLGGVSFLPSMLLAFLLAVAFMTRLTGEEPMTISLWTGTFFVSLILIYGVGIIDDLFGVTARMKFGVQIIAALLMPLSGLYINNLYGFMGIHEIPFWLGTVITVFIIVFIDNAINLIDGIDGLAGGLAFLALGGFLACFMREEVYTYCILISGLMGVLLPYLYFNILGDPEKNRKIFMGDSGSLTLGFILGFLFVKFSMHNPNVMPFHKDGLILSITMLIVPMFDVVRVVLMRTYHHRPLFSADKNHIHHKLMRTGLTQHMALMAILLAAMLFGVINLFFTQVHYIDLTYILLIDIAVFLLLNGLVDVAIKRRGEQIFS